MATNRRTRYLNLSVVTGLLINENYLCRDNNEGLFL